MKRRSIEELVYEHIFPHPKPTDPQNWAAFLLLHLVTEVREETNAFYGHLDTREAQYPGLDYSYPPHRMRLSRFTWHRRLFRAFDALGLTKSEIAGLAHWEGTRWAKEQFEREQNIKIRDTSDDWIHEGIMCNAVPSELTPEVDMYEFVQVEDNESSEDSDEMDEDGEESEIEPESIGVELNQRLRAGFRDEEYEQWLKEEAEAGGVFLLPGRSLRSDNAIPNRSSAYTRLPASLVNAILEADRLRNGPVSSARRQEASTLTSRADRTSGPSALSRVENGPFRPSYSLPPLRHTAFTSASQAHSTALRAPSDRLHGQASSRPTASFQR